ncbi:hypothetical protein CYMTET_25466, partial [Cymbomonas tetramitiformis]
GKRVYEGRLRTPDRLLRNLFASELLLLSPTIVIGKTCGRIMLATGGILESALRFYLLKIYPWN